MKLCCLYNKIAKKVKSLKELIDVLDGLVNLTDYFIEGNGVTPIRTCGTKWIRHLVKILQLSINKLGINLTYLS